MFEQVEFTEAMTAPTGVKPAILRDLGQVVILAGKNGSGKSRFLKLLEPARQSGIRRQQLLSARQSLLSGQPVAPQIPSLLHRRPHYNLEQIDEQLKAISQSLIRAETPLIQITLDELPTNNSVPAQTLAAMVALAGGRAQFPLNTIFKSISSLVLGIALAQWLPRIQDYAADPKSEENLRHAQSFNRLLDTLLSTTISPQFNPANGNVVPLLFGRPFQLKELSPGEQILLAWAFSLHAQAGGTDVPDSAIITIDEPEVHLHPAAHVYVLTRLYEGLLKQSTRQLWLATHSPSIIAHFASVGDVYLVESGAIQYAGGHLASAMNELLGGHNGRNQLRDFLVDADATEFATFMAQCLSDAMVSGRSHDGQSKQFLKVIASRAAAAKSIRILDYASGKARFARALGGLVGDIIDRIDYVTYDDPRHNQFVEERRHNVAALYPGEQERSAMRCSNDVSDFFNERRVDAIVMTNFLHELPPSEWMDELAKASKALADDGVLLLFEDTQISVGELPTKTGFIVPTLPDLRVLFETNEGLDEHEAANPRCSVIAVAKRTLENALSADESVRRKRLRETLCGIQDRSIRDIGAVRSTAERKHQGIAHARAVVQLANVTLALKGIT